MVNDEENVKMRKNKEPEGDPDSTRAFVCRQFKPPKIVFTSDSSISLTGLYAAATIPIARQSDERRAGRHQ
jgi:hypothetical protein